MKPRYLSLTCVMFCVVQSAVAQQKDVRPGDPSLDPSRLRLGADTVYLRWEVDGEERRGPRQIEELAVQWSGGKKLLRHVMTVETDDSRNLSDTTWYEFETLAPVAHRSHARQRSLVLEYDADAVTGFVEPMDSGRTQISVDLEHPVFDPSSSILVLRSFPLRAGLSLTYPLLNHATHDVRWHRVRVVGLERIEVGGVRVPAWKLTVQISDDRPDVTYWFAEEEQRLLRFEAPLGDGRTMRGAVSGLASTANLEGLMDRGMAALGGERALRSVGSLSVSEIGHTLLIEQSERPAGPWIPYYEDRDVLTDLDGLRLRTTTRSRFVQSADWSPERTIVADTGAAAFVLGERQIPAQVANVLEASWTLELHPLRVWFTAQKAPDVRIASDTVLQDVSHTIVTFTWRDRPVRIFVNDHTGLPTAVAVRAPELHGHGSVWGDAWVSQWFSTWSLEEAGLRFPRQRDVYFDRYPWKSSTVTEISFDVETPDDSFGITRATRDGFAAAAARGGLREMRLGEGVGGQPSEPVALPGGAVMLPGAWNVTLVPVDDGLVVLEAPISPDYSAQVLEEARRRFPNRDITAAISTSDAWPHVGGVREYVARNVPVYAVDVNIPLLERLTRRAWTVTPDALEQHRRPPRFRPVRGKTTLGTGDDILELYPIRSESGERMLMVYWPAHRLLYAADLIQQMRDGSFFWPLYLREVIDAVERERLDVQTVFAMHLDPTPWETILQAVPRANAVP